MAYASTFARESQLMDILGIEELELNEQEALLTDLGDLIFKGSMLRILELMEEAVKERFELLMAAEPSDEELEGFLLEYVPGADRAVMETVQELTDDILAVTGASQD